MTDSVDKVGVCLVRVGLMHRWWPALSASDSAFGMTLPVYETDFRLTQGEVKTYASTSAAGRGKLGAFCPDCGTRIYHKPEWRKGTVSIKPGTLDDTSWLKPEVHLWTSSKQGWVAIPEGVKSFDREPG